MSYNALYLGGALQTMVEDNRTILNNTNLYIGSNSGGNQLFQGYIDELRISNIARTPEWLKVCYASEFGTLIYYGATDPPPTLTTISASSISMDKDGVTSANLSGNLTSLGGAPTVNTWWDWGLTTAYGHSTANITRSITGVYSTLLPIS